MASGTLGVEESRERNRWGEGSKVYTRKFHNKGLKNKKSTTTTSITGSANENGDTATQAAAAAAAAPTNTNIENDRINDNDQNNGNKVAHQSFQTLATDANSCQQQHTLSQLEAVSDESSQHPRPPKEATPNGCEPPRNENGAIEPIVVEVDNRIRINLAATRSKGGIRELKRKLVTELEQVRSSVKKLEAKELQLSGYSTAVAAGISGYSHSQYSTNNERALVRVNSEVGSVGHHDLRPFQQLNVSVMENNNGASEFIEKEKRTPKANQFYRNSEFILGKERLPPAESNKKLKSNGGKKRGGVMRYGSSIDKYTSQALKSCNNLLTRLMKHKHAWVFNKPVDAEALGADDYHDIIKHPMDLGTVKTRLAKNWYKSPKEFAEDVRLTFHNAMTYNPKGHDVHVMAEELSNIFEEKWATIESQYCSDLRYELAHDVGLPTPTSRLVHPPPFSHPLPPPALEMRTLERAESMTIPVDSKLKSNAPAGRTPVPKKPKANDPHKRDMTYEEKQRLSKNLQCIPSEKLDCIVQIIKKRNSALSQHDDEIEVDIDSVDVETLWELDRFVTNYKKSLSKNKRKAEFALRTRDEAMPAVSAMNPAPGIVEAPKESKPADEKNGTKSPPAQREKGGNNVSNSSGSSSSSSDSGSSSSDSDSDSSSGCGSDAGHSPRT